MATLPTNAAATKSEIGEALTAAARDMVPQLRARARQAETDRRMPEETHRAFADAGFYRIFRPARFGGLELDYPVIVDIAAELGRGCGSSAWVFTNLAQPGIINGMKDPRAQEELWADDPDTLNYEGIERVTRFASNMVRDLTKGGERPDYVKVEKSTKGGNRDAIRVYLGTIPNYASEDVKGVLLSGVRGGAPADKAGLKAGDIIVRFAGKDIANIYDYTYALNAVKVGKPVEIEVMRKGKRIKLTVTPVSQR